MSFYFLHWGPKKLPNSIHIMVHTGCLECNAKILLISCVCNSELIFYRLKISIYIKTNFTLLNDKSCCLRKFFAYSMCFWILGAWSVWTLSRCLRPPLRVPLSAWIFHLIKKFNPLHSVTGQRCLIKKFTLFTQLQVKDTVNCKSSLALFSSCMQYCTCSCKVKQVNKYKFSES
jgi:hypothetical protein